MSMVQFIPTLRHNLCSITKFIEIGGRLSNKGEILKITFPDGKQLTFDYKIPTQNGYVMAAIIKPIRIVKDDEDDDNLTPMHINKFHMITHENKLTLKHTTKRLGF